MLDRDDRLLPRSGTPRWPPPSGQRAALARPARWSDVKPLEIKKSSRKDGKLSKEMQAALEAERIKKENKQE